MAKITWADRTDIKTALGVTYEAAATIYNTIKASVNALYDEKLDLLTATDQVVVSNVELPKVAIGVSTFLNTLDVAGGMAVGSGYAGLITTPTDGMIIEGNVGFGDDSAVDPVSVKGGKIKVVSNGDKLLCLEDDVSEANAFFKITNATGSPAFFAPIFWAKGNSQTSPGCHFLGDTALDAGTVPVLKFDARFNNGTVVNRPVFGLFNRTTQLITVLPNGDIGFGVDSPTAKADINQSSATGAKPVIKLSQVDISEEMIEFDTTIGVGNPIEAKGAKTFTETHFIKVTLPGGLTRYIPAGTIA